MRSLVVWAAGGRPPADEPDVLLWDAYLPAESPPSWISLPEQIAGASTLLQQRYHAWLHDVGAMIAPRLMVRPHLSAWWLSLPAEFPFEPDSNVLLIVRLMVFADVLAGLPPGTPVRIVAEDPVLTRLIAADAQHFGHPAGSADLSRAADLSLTSGARPGHEQAVHEQAVHEQAAPPAQLTLRRRVSSVIARHPWLAALRVLAAHARCISRSAPASRVALAGSGPLFIDYLAHLPQSARSTGVFASNYWGPLVDDLAGRQPAARWLHLSGRQATLAVLSADRDLTRRFDAAGPGHHALLHDWLSLAVLGQAIGDWWRQARHWRAVRTVRTPGSPAVQQVTRRALHESLVGRHGALNAIWLRCFERALAQIDDGPHACYLMENQPWEMTMLATWRAQRRGPIVGVVHSSVAPWNTRAFKDPRDMFPEPGMPARSGSAPLVTPDMPWPDHVAVNGPLATAHCRAAGYPAERLVEVEALRYLDLAGQSTRSGRDSTSTDGLRVIIFGEYDETTARRMLEMTAEAMAALARDPAGPAVAARFRPHPAGAVMTMTGSTMAGMPEHLELTTEGTMTSALSWADVAICGPLSTVVLESLCAGCRTIVIADPQVLDANPAAGLRGCVVVQNAGELTDQLAATRRSGWDPVQGSSVTPEEIFRLDPSLAGWRHLLT